MFQFYGEPVLRKVYIFCLVSGLSFLLLLGLQTYMGSRQEHYLSIEHNERVKTHISQFVQQKIRALQNEFQLLMLASSRVDLTVANNSIRDYIKQARDATIVLEHGGEYSETISVSPVEKSLQPHIFKYTPPENTLVSEPILDLLIKMKRLEQMRQEEYSTMVGVIQGEIASAAKIQEFKNDSIPFFARLVENSNQLYLDSLNALDAAEAARIKQAQSFKRITMALIPIVLLGGLWVAIRIWRDIRSLMRERTEALDYLGEANENLERLVAIRTAALREEVEERKEAEVRISCQAEFLTNILESLDHPFTVINAKDFTVSMANRVALEGALGESTHCHVLAHGNAKPCFERGLPCPLRVVKETKRPVIIERVVKRPDGDRRIEVHGYPIFNDEGEVVQMIEYSLDITEKYLAQVALEQARDDLEDKVQERTRRLEQEVENRVKAQQEVEASERHFRKLIENIRDIILILDQDGAITYASPSLRSVLGYRPEEFKGRQIMDFMRPEGHGAEPCKSLSALVAEADQSDFSFPDAYGVHHVIEATVQDKSDDETIGGLLVTLHDVTARKVAEENRKRLQEVVEQNPSSVIITDTRGNIEYVNPQFERITGYSREEVIGQNPRMLSSGVTDPEMFAEMYKTIARGEVWQGEFVNRKRSGELYDENVIVVPIKNDMGVITNYVALKENITELKKARQQAEDANRAKSEFLSRMSHELRTPLNAIIGFSRLLVDGKGSGLQPKQAEQASRIHASGLHLMQMISEILDFSRIESGNFSVEVSPSHVGGILQECQMLTEHLAREKDVRVELEGGVYNLPPLLLDQTRFKQVMINLMSNAIKYNKPGGSVTISVRREGCQAEILVTDTGIGIAKEKQQEIFTPFTRLASDADFIEGTGIGMTITKQLVEAMDGEITFTSSEGVGSVFSVILPVAGVIQTDDDCVLEDELQGPAITVLYVDNDADRIKAAREVVARWPEATLVVRKTTEKGFKAIGLLKPALVVVHSRFGDEGTRQRVAAVVGEDALPLVLVASEKKFDVPDGMGDGWVPLPLTHRELLETYMQFREGRK